MVNDTKLNLQILALIVVISEDGGLNDLAINHRAINTKVFVCYFR
jgi:hypothetical protein